MEKTFAIVCRPDALSRQIAGQIKEVLQAAGQQENNAEPDVVFVVGGDGTFLYAVHAYLEQWERVFFYGIHTGTLGFYSDYRDQELSEFLDVYLSGKTREFSCPLIQVDSALGTQYAINEMRIENVARTQTIGISVNGEFFETFRGTGLCVSTQLGSTAYNRSLRGAVVQEGLNVLQMAEIAGIHHSKFLSLGSPLVMQGSSVLQLHAEDFSGAILGTDQDVQRLDKVHDVTVRISQQRHIRVLRGREVSYFHRLQSLF